MTTAAVMELWSLFLLLAVSHAQRVAVIGGGISGSFVTKYLMDSDDSCALESITIFEPFPLTGPISSSQAPREDEQYSRVQTIRLDDGTLVEIGASIAYKDFHLVMEMIRGDPGNLVITGPFSTSTDEEGEAHVTHSRHGMGIYNGNGDWKLLLSSTASSWRRKLELVWRYGWDLYRVSQICSDCLAAFARLPELLKSKDPGTYFESPDQIWFKLGLGNMVHHPFETLLNAAGVSKQISYIRSFLPYQGDLRRELLDAINLVNYNQDNTLVNGVVGLGSFAASRGGIFSIHGGNSKLIASALRQAAHVAETVCQRKDKIREVAHRVTTVVAGLEQFELFSDSESLGSYDILILAAPLHSARIDFFIQSHFDPAVLQPMHFGGGVDADDSENDLKDHKHAILSNGLPEYAMRPYKQVTTTVISNGTLNASMFNIKEDQMPKSILMTKYGKSSCHNITAITQIKASTGVYKVFSDDKLDDNVLLELFGPHRQVEYVKLWGGAYGGATPDYRGDGMSLPFLLYDSAANLQGHTRGGAIYYPSSMEQSSLASMELAAVGAKAVAKLVAQRLELESGAEPVERRDEL